jgi:SAM-dependent methyltransferase
MVMDPAEWKQRTTSHWDRAAAPWDRWFDWYSRTLRPLSIWSCDAAGVSAGVRVLDIACGTGEPALTAATRVGPDGFVLATDIAPAMVTAAEQRARLAGLRNIQFAVMDAESLDVPAASFDSCTFACGLMFCPEPEKAAASVYRALRPGGRFAISVWDRPERNAFAMVFGTAVSQVLGVPLPEALAPGPFRLANPDALATVLREGGLTKFSIESKPLTFAYDSVEQYLAITSDFACGLRPRLEALSTTDREQFADLVRQLVAPYVDGGIVRLPATPLCAWGVISG